LLKPAKRAAYDEELRQRLADKQPGFVPAAPAFSPAGAPPQTANPAIRSAASAGVAGRTNGTPLPPPPLAAPPRIDDLDGADGRIPAFGTKTFVVVGSLLILLLVVAIVIVAKSGWKSGSSSPTATTKPSDGGLADGTNQNSKTGEATPVPIPPSVETTTTNPPLSLPLNPEEKPSVNTSVAPTAASTNTNAAATTTDAVKKPDVPPTVPNPTSTSTTGTNPPANPTAPAATAENSAPKKLLVPDAMAAAAVEARFAEMFADAPPEAILEQSKPLTDGPLVYVALTKALNTSASSGNSALAGRIVDELSRRFTIETVPLRVKTYLDLQQHVTTIADWHALGEAALAAIDEAVAANRADLALSLGETGLLAARKSGNLELIRRVTLRVLELQGQSAAKPDSAKSDTAKPPVATPKRDGSDQA
jgi:hypothetical protein